MDACHLLLRRPWQYDRKVIHDGFKNTYIFHKNGVKITLCPSKLKSTPKASKANENHLLSKIEIDKALVEGDETFMLIVIEENEARQKVLPIMELFLQEFHDVVPEEIPLGLLPIRDIQH